MSSFLWPDSATRKGFTQATVRYEVIKTKKGRKQIVIKTKRKKFRIKRSDVPRNSTQAKLAQSKPNTKGSFFGRAFSKTKAFFKNLVKK